MVQHIVQEGKGKGRKCWLSGALAYTDAERGHIAARLQGKGPRPVTRDEIEALIARAAMGERAAFEGLYTHTSAKLMAICLRVLGDRAEAEEALQESFVKIWRHADRYRANGLSPMTWLITIARNTAIDRARKRREAQPGLDQAETLADATPGPEAQAIASSERTALTACLSELDEANAQAVQRAYLDGETYAELATRFGVPLNTMRTRLRRSLMKLKECLTR
ncbi:RNA polymerase sigma-70 factor, ECF subfamily [Roseovarius nanhaiticus]|uniref:RNA polymerase sigma-70 factor, ECF subfamily n=2 Tax=Roseovarius nanhaiticus TaxID=573024 RepID=A0A1N7G2B2_9RHOB|nr:RNA polymerase sigma-70 factor, ECF subfamily [Roseovarius nanhaiticus]SIS06576.1 RNA polymerase sigma-70 factor, ECF subfamily [Roseovarius nanhaiticus]